MAGQRAKSSKKNRKFGRNKKFCERYRAEGRRLRNKARKLRAHLHRFPSDGQAGKVLKNLV